MKTVDILPTIETSKLNFVKVFLPKQYQNSTKDNMPKNTPLKFA